MTRLKGSVNKDNHWRINILSPTNGVDIIWSKEYTTVYAMSTDVSCMFSNAQIKSYVQGSRNPPKCVQIVKL